MEQEDPMVIFPDGQMVRSSDILGVQKVQNTEEEWWAVRVLMASYDNWLQFNCTSEQEQAALLKEVSVLVQEAMGIKPSKEGKSKK